VLGKRLMEFQSKLRTVPLEIIESLGITLKKKSKKFALDTKNEEFEIQMDQGPFITYLQLGVRNTFDDDLKAVKALPKRYRFSDGLLYTYNEITDHVVME